VIISQPRPRVLKDAGNFAEKFGRFGIC
jgi:hypothetical protein